MIDDVLYTFQWAYPGRSENRGEIHTEGDLLVLLVWCADNDNPDNTELKELRVERTIDPYESPRDQIRTLIHMYLCHEADEQMWFGDERPFYPH